VASAWWGTLDIGTVVWIDILVLGDEVVPLGEERVGIFITQGRNANRPLRLRRESP